MKEIWKSIPGFEGQYEASDLGRVRSLDRWIKSNISPSGECMRHGQIIVQSLRKKGYTMLGLCKDGKYKTYSVHRLILMAFRGISKLEVNHLNGIKSDNRLINLEYCTSQQNAIHAVKNKLRIAAKGENHAFAILNSTQVIEIRKLHLTGKYQLKEIAKKYNMHPSTIRGIVIRKIWRHI